MCSEDLVLTRSPYELPAGCPVVVAVSPDHPTFSPMVTVTRDAMPVDVTGPVATMATTVTALSETVTPNGSGCSLNSAYVALPFDIHTISIAGANIGEQLSLSTGPVAVVVAAGPCPATTPIEPAEVECRVTHEQYWDCTCAVRPDAIECGGGEPPPPPDESTGCAASSPGLAVLLAFVLVRARR